jgi:exoribonuclease R
VQPGDAVDVEARARGVTLYSPDLRTPLHPTSLSEHAASLLPGVDRPAVVWRHDLDGAGRVAADPVVERAVVRSRAQLDYPSVQAELDAGTADALIGLLREVGLARLDQERARGGVSLDLAEQEVVHVDGHYRLVYRRPLLVESWNAQLSLLTGIAAAQLMVAAGVGLLRTLPDPDPATVAAIRRSAQALGIAVSNEAPYAEIVRAADPASDAGAALLHQAARALRGAGYSVLDGGPPPAVIEHSAIASTYAHVTAPLRRLGDRFAQEVSVSLAAGAPVPTWVRDALPTLPKILGAANERDGALARAMVDVVEALMLRDRVGEVFEGVVTNVDDRGAVVQLRDPAVLARVGGIDASQLGQELRVRLDRVDVPARKLVLSVVVSGG